MASKNLCLKFCKWGKKFFVLPIEKCSFLSILCLNGIKNKEAFRSGKTWGPKHTTVI